MLPRNEPQGSSHLRQDGPYPLTPSAQRTVWLVAPMLARLHLGPAPLAGTVPRCDWERKSRSRRGAGQESPGKLLICSALAVCPGSAPSPRGEGGLHQGRHMLSLVFNRDRMAGGLTQAYTGSGPALSTRARLNQAPCPPELPVKRWSYARGLTGQAEDCGSKHRQACLGTAREAAWRRRCEPASEHEIVME